MTSEWDGTPWQGSAQVVQKAVTGPGAGFYSTGIPLIGNARTPQELMRRAQLAYHVNPWIGTAETVVTRKVTGLPWHLEDGEDEEYGDDAPPDVKAARLLIERPQFLLPPDARKPGVSTKRLMWGLTSRHLGLCGMSHWYGDQMDGQGIPLAWLYLNPARMWAAEDAAGNTTGWVYDATGTNGRGQPLGGIPLELSTVLTFYLDPPDNGSYGTGLYERAVLKAQITTLADQHAAYVLGTGGRIAGLVSPKTGVIPDEAFQQLLRTFRDVNEAPDAAKRTTILQNPVDFTPQAADPSELDLVEIDKLNRDDIFTIWGVPGSQAPVQTAAGLNSGETKGYDEAILMQGAVHDRVTAITETLQYQWLDKYLPLVIELEIEEPEFDDESPAFARAQQARELPLTNRERRAIVGLDPTGDDAIDNAILLPGTLTVWATAPGEGGTVGSITPEPTVVQLPPQNLPEIPEEKADTRKEFLGLRKSLDTRIVPSTRKTLEGTLTAQKNAIVAWVRSHETHLARKPKDEGWWNESREDERLTAALRPVVSGIAETVTKRAKDVLDRPSKAEFEERVQQSLLTATGKRIRGINDHTRLQIAELIRQGFDQGMSPAEVADAIEASTLFDPARAEVIARTETMFAYNSAAIDSYREFGVEQVEALDGDFDEVCAERNGQVFTLEEASAIEDHPNGTLDWAPYFGGKAAVPVAPQVSPEPAGLAALLEAAKAAPVTIQMYDGKMLKTRTIIDRDAVTGRVIGYHDEPYDAA